MTSYLPDLTANEIAALSPCSKVVLDMNKRIMNEQHRRFPPKITKRKSKRVGNTIESIDSSSFCNNLNDEQKACFVRITQSDRSFFITGKAGCGKSFLLSRIILYFRSCLPSKGSLGVTATTGLAAQNIWGQTIHSLIGFVPQLDRHSLKDVQLYITMIKNNSGAVYRIKKLQVLIIDEVSQMHTQYFQMMNAIFISIRGNTLPFGGIRLIMCGDFMQLPPVHEDGAFVFQSELWKDHIHIVRLKSNVRHADEDTIAFMDFVRVGAPSANKPDYFDRLVSRLSSTNPADMRIRLFCTKKRVVEYNYERLTQGAGPNDIQTYISVDWFSGLCQTYDARTMSGLKETLDNLCDRQVLLKIGAPVMVTKNLNMFNNNRVSNGGRGTILALADDCVTVKMDICGRIHNFQSVEFKVFDACGQVLASRSAVPIVLAYATTIHKAQGATLDKAHVTIENEFAAGLIYVAVSRVSHIENLSLSLWGTGLLDLKVDAECLTYSDL